MSCDGRKAPPPAPAPPLPRSRKLITSSNDRAAATTPGFLEIHESTRADSLKRLIERPLVDEQPYKPVYYFFYGTLTQPKILSHILDLEEQPVLRPAKLTGYALARWGQYRALVDGEPGEEVTGHASLVHSAEDELKLARYETDAYEAVPCGIWFTDGGALTKEQGITFKYAGDDEALKEGRFDRKLWEVRMGVRLPGKWRAGDLSES